MCLGILPACMYICVRVPDPLKTELQIVVNFHLGYRELNLGPLEKQPLLLMAEPPLQSLNLFFELCACVRVGT